MSYSVEIIDSDADIMLCFQAFKELRPKLDKQQFIQQVIRQAQHGYCIAAIKNNAAVVSVAGFRITEFLAWGKVLYVDDLSTLKQYRKQGYAAALMDWLIQHAKANNCDALHLDSGHHRHAAHKLYLKKGLSISSHHLSLEDLKHS
ncbi:GNAT family N-acetyltransferase [Agaribacterium haliotis]|uniref:GNAT family N-acetyltransferase n=1 Tax=Agaribacterium haliotis TaxID=2013869 RepID=UPI000BB52D02|nr:GNAT family N-acetyltransferase [Agaribacterium haliotis]